MHCGKEFFLLWGGGVSVFTLISECYSYLKNFIHLLISKHLSAAKSAGLHDKFIPRRTDSAHLCKVCCERLSAISFNRCIDCGPLYQLGFAVYIALGFFLQSLCRETLKMASCYHCGINIRNGEGYRRQVVTSQSARIYFTKRGGGSYGQSYGLRTLCASCTQRLDQNNKALAWKLPVSLLIGLIGAAITFRSRNSFDGAIGGLIFLFLVFGGAGLITFWLLGFISNPELNSSGQTLASNQEELEPSIGNSYTQQQYTKHESLPNKDASLDLSPYIRALRAAGARAESFGLSFFGVYGLETKQENVQRIADIVFNTLPPIHERNAAIWEETLFRLTCQRFLNEFSSATNPVKLDLLLLIFPSKPEESSEEYLSRLHTAVEQILSIVLPNTGSEEHPANV
jgi:hypothetical protein